MFSGVFGGITDRPNDNLFLGSCSGFPSRITHDSRVALLVSGSLLAGQGCPRFIPCKSSTPLVGKLVLSVPVTCQSGRTSVLLSAPAQLTHTEPITISVQYIILLVPYSSVRCPFSVLQIPCLIMRSKKFSTSPYQLHASYPQPLMPSKSRKKPSASAGAYPSLSGYSNSVRIPRDSGESIMAVFGSEQIPKI